MQSLVPRAIAIIEFGAEGDNCAVAKYKTTKMADKRRILAVIHIPRCSYPKVFFPVPRQFQGQNLRENPPPCRHRRIFIYINDIHNSTDKLSFYYLFADDTNNRVQTKT